MTFIAGFIEKDNIFLFSDTAVTDWESNKEVQSSSFGETTYSDEERIVYQSEIKLFTENNDRLIIGGSGTSKSIDSFIENIETYSNYGLSCNRIIESALDNIEDNDFEILLGYFDNDIPVLYKKSTNSIELENCSNDISCIGVEGKHFNLFKRNFNELKSQTSNFESWNPKKISVAVNSILQAYGT